MKRYVLLHKGTGRYWPWDDGGTTDALQDARIFNMRRLPHDGWHKDEQKNWLWVPVEIRVGPW